MRKTSSRTGLPMPVGGRPPGVIADGARLRRIRRARGLSMTELSRRVSIGYKTVWRAENGKPISEAAALQIAEALDHARPPVTPRHFVPGWPEDDGSEPRALAS